jgi:hypothetical protein
MRIFTHVDEQRERVIVTYGGDIILHDVMEMMLTSEKARVLVFPTLIDASRASIRLSEDDLREIQRVETDLATRHRIAKCAILVMNEKELQKADAAVELLREISPMRAFVDRGAAEEWLGWT